MLIYSGWYSIDQSFITWETIEYLTSRFDSLSSGVGVTDYFTNAFSIVCDR